MSKKICKTEKDKKDLKKKDLKFACEKCGSQSDKQGKLCKPEKQK